MDTWITKDGDRACAYPGCRTTVGYEDYCAGCGYYICAAHSQNDNAGGSGHDLIEHWTFEDGDEV